MFVVLLQFGHYTGRSTQDVPNVWALWVTGSKKDIVSTYSLGYIFYQCIYGFIPV
jgi:uncharacterized protein (DUF3820 family)